MSRKLPYGPAYMDSELNRYMKQAIENKSSKMYDFAGFYPRSDGKYESSSLETIVGVQSTESKKKEVMIFFRKDHTRMWINVIRKAKWTQPSPKNISYIDPGQKTPVQSLPRSKMGYDQFRHYNASPDVNTGSKENLGELQKR